MTEAAPQPPAPTRRRGMGSWRSMIWSSLIVLAIVLVWYAMVAMPDRLPERTVDADTLTVATERETGRDVVQAEGLSGEWAATQAQLTRGDGDDVWHVTYRTPQGRHLSVDQRFVTAEEGRAGVPAWIGVKTGETTDEGTLEADGRTWRTGLRPDPDRRSAVLEEAPDDTVVVVSGDASQEELTELVESLRFDGAPAGGGSQPSASS